MRLNKRQIQWMIENDLLLESASFTDGSLSTIINGVKGPLSEFGDVISGAVGLVMVDINYLLKLTVFSVFLMNSDTRARLKKEKNNRRAKFLQKVQKGWDTSSLSGDQKFMMTMLNPAAVFGGMGLAAAAKPFDPEWRSQLGDMGFDQLPPPLGTIFDVDFEWESPDLWRQMSNAKSDDDAMKILSTKLDGLLKNTTPTPNNDVPDTSTLGIPNSALALTSLFMLATEDDEVEGDILVEGDEEPDVKLTDKDYEYLRKWIGGLVQEHFSIPGDDLLKLKEKELKSYIGDIPKAVDAVCTLTASRDKKAFFDGLGALKKVLGDEAKKFDLDKVNDAFDKAKQAVKDDDESMQKLKKQFEEAKEEPNEAKLDAKLDEIALSGFKAKFIQQVKEGIEDLLENTNEEIYDGMTQKELKIVKQTDLGKQYLQLCKKYEDQINKGLSKLKQA